MPKLLLGISGGIAAYKSLELIRLLKKSNYEVKVCMTHSAEHFVTPLSCQTLSGHPVYRDILEPLHDDAMDHIALAKWADIYLIAPATANVIAKLSHGMADDLLTTGALAFQGQLHIAPAMNQAMYNHPITQSNIDQLLETGVNIIGPDFGDQACGDCGPGRLLDPSKILATILSINAPKPLAGKSVLITAGPTHEPIDPVRYVGNRSSGKMGYAMAATARQLGADVTLISGPASLTTPYGVKPISVETALEMREAVFNHIEHTDFFVSCAAISDYRPIKIADHKIKKTSKHLTLELEKNPDILLEVGHQTFQGTIIGFAAETDNLIENAKNKCLAKKCDMIFANQVGKDTAFDQDENAITVVGPDGILADFPKQNKKDLAQSLWHFIVEQTLEVVE